MAFQNSCIVVPNGDCSCFTVFDNSLWTDPPLPANVVTATINVTVPGQITPYSYSVPTGSIPNLFDPNVGVQVCASDLGYGDFFPDNEYTITYTIRYTMVLHGPVFTVTYVIIKAFICGILCCMRKKRLSLPPPPPRGCDYEVYEKLSLAEGVLRSLLYANCCGNMQSALQDIEWLKSYCANCGIPPHSVQRQDAGCGCHSTPERHNQDGRWNNS